MVAIESFYGSKLIAAGDLGLHTIHIMGLYRLFHKSSILYKLKSNGQMVWYGRNYGHTAVFMVYDRISWLKCKTELQRY